MNKNKALVVWLPFIIACSVAVGIFVGNYYMRHASHRNKKYTTGNKINAILDIVEEQYVDTVDMSQLIEEAIPKIFSELDPHSGYIPAKNLEESNEVLRGSFSGIGIEFNMLTDTIAIVHVVPGGPAEKAGLIAGDRIIMIDDSVYVGKDRQDEIMKKLRGEKNSTVKLGIKRDMAPELLTLEVTRGDVPVNSVEIAFEISKGIGYIKVNKFALTTYNEFITAIAKLKQQGCTAFIVDLRNNSGGYMDAAVNMINEFLPNGSLIVYMEGKAVPRSERIANGTGTCQDAPLVVLTDEFSGSASEIFAGAVQDNDRGLIIGRRTYGKGLVQDQIALSDGSAFRLTIARYYTPSGRCIQKSYQMGKSEEYEQAFYNRFMHGEMDSKDSIHINKDLKFQTKLGRTVYGGGGIMPDIFVPRDTTGYTSYFLSAVNSLVLWQFAFAYADSNRQFLSSFKNYKDMLKYLQSQPILNEFVEYAAARGIKKRPTLINISRKLLEKRLYADILRNFFDEEGFYPIYLEDDMPVLKAIEAINTGKTYPVASEAEENKNK